MLAPWPEADTAAVDDPAERAMDLLMDLIRQIRNARAEFNVTPGRRIPAIVAGAGQLAMLESQRELLAFLARLDEKKLELHTTLDEKPQQAVALVAAEGVEAYLPLAGLVDLEQERQRLRKGLDEVASDIQRAQGLLANENFTTRAPAEVVDRERTKLAELQERRGRLQARLNALEG
jgi:valyl-tRNA synthetase